MNDQLEPIRAKYNLPALGGAIFTTDGVVEMAAVGMRKRGDPTPVTDADLWHLGSNTKMMTATLAGTFVAEGKLSWDAKVVSFFPEIAGQVPAAARDITIAQVMDHRAGLVENLNWFLLSALGTLSEQRRMAAGMALTKPAYPPGAFHYSNTDYVVIGAILEKIGGKPWEDLIRERLFGPLGMNSAGFGPPGTAGAIDQPLPHDAEGKPLGFDAPVRDNPPVLGPAGTAHCSMADWSKYLVDQLRGAAGMKALLPPEIYRAIQTPPPGADYAFGWGVVSRPWAGGIALTHSGSNTLNFCVCWLAPAKKFGVLVCCNQGGDIAAKACDDAASMLIQREQARLKTAPPEKP